MTCRWKNSRVQFTNVEDLLAAEKAGQLTIGPVVQRFQCPLIAAQPSDKP